MLNKLIGPLAVVMTLAVAATPASAAEIPVVSAAGATLRAGPAASYPAVVRLPAGSHLVLHGCLVRYDWCDVSFGGDRGWLAGGSLYAMRGNVRLALTAAAATRLGIAIVAFDAGYWRRYYFGRPWYRRWHRYWGW